MTNNKSIYIKIKNRQSVQHRERIVLDKKKINNNKNWRKEWEIE